ncbi:MAG: hypothetical protein FWB93_05240 [Oscillospiraceae bacterium]|nr:hypothetical protein [Oscillospiraceae bacterium]
MAKKLLPKLKRTIQNSGTGRMFYFVARIDDHARRGALGGLVGRYAPGQVLRPFVSKTARAIEGSLLVAWLRTLLAVMLRQPVRVYGSLMFSFGFYAAIIQIFRTFEVYGELLHPHALVTGAGIMVASLPLVLFGKRTLSAALLQSRIASAFLFSMMGLKREDFAESESRGNGGMVAFAVGTALGLSTLFVSAEFILLGIAVLLVALAILRMPESGIPLLLFITPFVGANVVILHGIIAFTFASYLLRIMRGKRNLNFSFTDGAVVLFAFIAFLQLAFLPNGNLLDGMNFFAFVFTYILVVGLIRERVWLARCTTVICFVTFVHGLHAILVFFYDVLPAGLHRVALYLGAFGQRIVAPTNFLVLYFMIGLPFLMARVLLETKFRTKFWMFVMFVLSSIGFMLSTFTDGAVQNNVLAIISLTVGTLLALFFFNRRRFIAIGFAIAIIFAVLQIAVIFAHNDWLADAVPITADINLDGLLNTLIRPYFNQHGGSTFVQLFGVVGFLLIAAIIFCGVAAAIVAPKRRTVLVSYATKTENTLRITLLASLSAILAVLVHSRLEYVFACGQIAMSFWICFGLIITTTRCAVRELYVPTGNANAADVDIRI